MPPLLDVYHVIPHSNNSWHVDLLSGPGGLASFLRRRQLGTRLGGPSLPLDVGVSADIPAAVRRAVILRDQHCRFPGGCDQPAAGCEVHHLRHRKDGGPTSVKDCALFCFFHHQVVIHQWGWTVVLNPDGTTTAWNTCRSPLAATSRAAGCEVHHVRHGKDAGPDLHPIR